MSGNQSKDQPLDNLNTTGNPPPSQANSQEVGGGKNRQGTVTGPGETAQVPPGSKTGTYNRQSDQGAGSNASVGGPGGPDAGSDAMPGNSNAL